MQIDEEKEGNSLFATLSYYKDWLDVRADPSQLMITAGGFKRFSRGIYDGEAVSVSVLNGTAFMANVDQRKLFARELCAMKVLSNHPCVARFHGYCSTNLLNEDEQILLVNKLYDSEDLEKFVKTDEFDQMTTKDRMMLCIDILRLLNVMHEEGIYHRMLLFFIQLTC